MSNTPILGAGTNFSINANGYIASFITDAGDPNLLLIPGGNWNFETYFQASSGGGTPSFYVELYKVNSGGTATLVASNSANPELIAFGTTTTAYFSSLAVPATVLTLTDRLALRYYVTHAGRTITMHTENSNLCQIITTFTTGLTALNGLTAQVQNFATGSSGTDFGISSSTSTHTFNLPTASATNRGALSSADWTTFNNKQPAGNYVTTDTNQSITGIKSFANGFSLAGIGGGNQPTTIKNIGTIHEGSGSTNQIGFNNSNNIYFGKGLSNGGVLQWTNSAVRYYTLPDSDGTLALTSSLGSYLPLTGGTLTGPLNGTTASFSGSSATMATIDSTNGSGYTALQINASGIAKGLIGFGTYLTTDGGVAIRTAASTPFTIAIGGGTPTLTLASTGAATFSNSVTANSLLVERSASRNMLGISSISLPTSGAEEGVAVIKTNSSLWQMSLVGYAADSKGLRIYNTGGTGYTSLEVATGAGTAFIVDGNGRVGIGTASPSTRLHVTNTSAGESRVALFLHNNSTTLNTETRLAFAANSNDEVSSNRYSYISALNTSSSNGQALIFATNETGAAAVERMRITSGGNVGIGTTTPSNKLTVSNAANGTIASFTNTSDADFFINLTSGVTLLSPTTGTLAFGTSSTERMRITSGGALLVGKTDPTVDTGDGLRVDSDGTLFACIANAESSYYVRDITNATYRFRVSGAGTVFATNTTISSISDERLKENIRDLDSGLDKIMLLKPRVFDWKEGSGQTGKDIRGFIAQEVEEFFPEMIDEWGNENLEEGETPYKSVRMDVIPMLVKAIQELKAEIDSLKTK
jgi:hypothetical protein